MHTRTICKTYSKSQAPIVVASLLESSRWFAVDPMPFDCASITVKTEGCDILPKQIGYDGMCWKEWIGMVDREFVGGLAKEGKNDFREYFLRGLSPMEAVAQDQSDDEE